MEGRESYVTVAEAAKIAGLHRNTILSRIRKGALPAQEVMDGQGRKTYRVRPADLVKSEGPHPIFASLIAQQLGKELWKAMRKDFQEYGFQLMGQSYRDELGHKMGLIRQELGREKALREVAEKEVERLRSELEALRRGV